MNSLTDPRDDMKHYVAAVNQCRGLRDTYTMKIGMTFRLQFLYNCGIVTAVGGSVILRRDFVTEGEWKRRGL